jgi:flagellar motility protein MotE (MotC chaperone)
MNRTLPLIIGALLLGALGGYGVSVARGAPGEGPLSVRATADQGKDRLYSLLMRKDAALKRREELVENEKQDLRTAEAALETRLLELQNLRDQIRGMLTDLDGEREERVASLVKMFESMRPKQAAAILQVTDDEIALEVLERMNRGKAGKTLAAMEPKRAATLAERIGRAALTEPEEG